MLILSMSVLIERRPETNQPFCGNDHDYPDLAPWCTDPGAESVFTRVVDQIDPMYKTLWIIFLAAALMFVGCVGVFFKQGRPRVTSRRQALAIAALEAQKEAWARHDFTTYYYNEELHMPVEHGQEDQAARQVAAAQVLDDEEEARVAPPEIHPGAENAFYYNTDLQLWVERGREEEYAARGAADEAIANALTNADGRRKRTDAAPAPLPVISKEEEAAAAIKPSTCCICLDAPASTVFLECAHQACCRTCTQGLKHCPMCRAPITRVIFPYKT